jgi:DNA invertase Pin-like site-specific DNA recombinase
MTDPKIRLDHLRRQAVVYVRQSTVQQVRGNRESTARQYALADRARGLGWPAGSVQTIDDDQGRSATRSDHRDGFKALLAEIGAGQVGVVLALEASRLARSSVDWHRLVEICVVTKTLLADESAVYDPRDPNDRLLLGLKGTLSEAELMTIRCRMHEGRWAKARNWLVLSPSATFARSPEAWSSIRTTRSRPASATCSTSSRNCV